MLGLLKPKLILMIAPFFVDRLQCRTDELETLKTQHADTDAKISELERLCRQKDVEIGETKSELENIVKNHEGKSGHILQTMNQFHSQVNFKPGFTIFLMI